MNALVKTTKNDRPDRESSVCEEGALTPLHNTLSIHIEFAVVVENGAQVFIWCDNFNLVIVYDSLLRNICSNVFLLHVQHFGSTKNRF